MQRGGGNPNCSSIPIKPNDQFGLWLVLELGPKSKNGHFRWHCKCTCGLTKLVFATALRRRISNSCVVCAAAGRGHNWSGTPTYKAWENMHSRCTTDPNVACYKNYRGRGIRVCKRWFNFENFLADMGKKPEGLSLDREDNDKGYFKNNCRWATPIQQANNGRHNVNIKYKGKVRTLAEWARALNLTRRQAAKKFGVRA